MSGDCPHGTYHVEISLKPHSTARNADVKENVKNFLSSLSVNGGDISLQEFDEPFFKQHVRRICIQPVGQTHSQQTVYSLDTQNVELHVYQLHEGGPGQEEITDEDLAAANHWLLPSANFDGVWESLVYDDEIKAKLLSYAATTLLFSDKRVDSNIISWNRVILLHGPPGTGKTSLCKALAQKLSIRLSDRFSYGQLIEINSHSLFSKWFSESGKLVMKMFQKIQELIDDPEALVCVLIDEVESLTAARKSAMSGSEPSDSIRVVNAVLTQLDQIKSYPNVLILTTSNVTGAIDLAFVDRADIKQYIGPPSMAAIFSIYKSCVNELMRVGIISPSQSLLDMRTLELMRFDENDVTKLSLDLMQISRESVGLSGRALRKIPFITQAVHIQKPTVTLTEYLLALQKAVKQQFQEQSDLSKD